MEPVQRSLEILTGIFAKDGKLDKKEREIVLEYAVTEFHAKAVDPLTSVDELLARGTSDLIRRLGLSARDFALNASESEVKSLTGAVVRLLLAGRKVDPGKLELALLVCGFLGADLESELRAAIRDS